MDTYINRKKMHTCYVRCYLYDWHSVPQHVRVQQHVGVPQHVRIQQHVGVRQHIRVFNNTFGETRCTPPRDHGAGHRGTLSSTLSGPLSRTMI